METQSPSMKFQKGKVKDHLKKIESPLIQKIASPKIKMKTLMKMMKRLSKTSDETNYDEKSSPLTCMKSSRRNIQNFQRTIWDIWGPELLNRKRPNLDS